MDAWFWNTFRSGLEEREEPCAIYQRRVGGLKDEGQNRGGVSAVTTPVPWNKMEQGGHVPYRAESGAALDSLVLGMGRRSERPGLHVLRMYVHMVGICRDSPVK